MAIMLGMMLWTGCGSDPAPDESVPETTQLSSPTAAALAALEKADAADGTSDKLVTRCLPCNLSMAGKAEHASKYGEYTVHLCSDHCKAYFERDPEKVLASLK